MQYHCYAKGSVFVKLHPHNSISQRSQFRRRFSTKSDNQGDNNQELEALKSLCDSGSPNIDLCEIPELQELDKEPTTSSLSSSDSAAAAPSIFEESSNRLKWLLSLLIFQSTSSFILDSYQDLLKQHLVVTLFLTMLVGAGGNAGNQSAIRIIRGLATGQLNTKTSTILTVLKQQLSVGLILGSVLSAGGFIRVYLTNRNILDSTAIATSLFVIVATSVLVGTALPFGLARCGVDPANAGTSIQVLMDCLGVLITCICTHYILDIFAHSLTVA
jgi:Mg/Co/Ni transporter MgtE